MKQKLYMAVLIMFCVAGLTPHAYAGSFSWYLTGTNSPSQVPCSPAAPCAEVTLNTFGTDLATLTVTSLLNGYIFDTFGFNTIAGVTVTEQSASGEIGAGNKLNGSGNEDGFGSFKYNFDTGKNGGSNGGDCVNHGTGCTFSLTLLGSTILTAADFEVLSSGGNGSGYFAGHLAAGGGNSGFVGDTVPVPIDEPASMAVTIPALLFLGIGFLRRRKQGRTIASAQQW